MLAEFLFGEAERLTRFDMSEFSSPPAVERLIGGTCSREGLLTARVREQPFSVLLLDEIEKAHPQFFDLLLQVTGEGRLTDQWGRTADFSNTVIIMTSNLGAHLFRKKRPGFDTNEVDSNSLQLVETEVRAFFRPELINRLDRIVPFYPLEQATLYDIARHQLHQLKQRDGFLTRQVDLIMTPEVIHYLATKGYDPRYGARPLRRQIEREILAPLSQQLNRRHATHTLAARLHVVDGCLDIQVHSTGTRKDVGVFEKSRTTQDIDRIAELRRTAQKMLRGRELQFFRNDIIRLKKLTEKVKVRLQRGKYVKPAQQQMLSQLAQKQRVAKALDHQWQQICETEDRILSMLYESLEEQEDFGERIQELQQAWQQVLLTWYCLRFTTTDRITLALYSKHRRFLLELGQTYYDLFSNQEHDVTLFWLQRKPGTPVAFERHKVKKPDRFWEIPDPRISWLIFDLKDHAVYPRYVQENGVHRFTTEHKKSFDCLAHTRPESGDIYMPPAVQHGAIEEQSVRREYLPERQMLRDRNLNKEFRFPHGSQSAALQQAIETSLHEQIRRLLLT